MSVLGRAHTWEKFAGIGRQGPCGAGLIRYRVQAAVSTSEKVLYFICHLDTAWRHRVVSSPRVRPGSVLSDALICGAGPGIKRHSNDYLGIHSVIHEV